MPFRTTRLILFLLLCTTGSLLTFAQIGKITVDLEKDKPEKFKEKVLRSEKTGEKKFTVPRRFMQNTTTHYNYYFNANNKINTVIERARLSNKDDYSKLLPFYGYSLDNTATQNTELDSVIYKATAGILLHDLRSDWVDDMYLLIGKAYFLRKTLDSAAMTFQFINYNLYPKSKKSEDDQMIVGSINNGGSSMSIANKENKNILKKAPTRNEALIWQARTFIEMEEYPDAAGLINTLRNDPNFPGRLKSDLEETNSYWFYKQGEYDSAAKHLEKALSNALDKDDKARWEFLLAQLYEMTNQPVKAFDYYTRASHHTTDPLMDIFANLNKAKMYKSTDPKELDNTIANLLKMAKRDKFESYKDIIYFSAAELALQKPDTAFAEFLLKKSIAANESNISYKNKAFLKLADIYFAKKDYRNAYANYDSLQTGDTTLGNLAQIQERKLILGKIVEQITIIEREDSLQRIAAMTPGDREAFLKKLAKKLRKEQGYKDDDQRSSNPSSAFDNKNLPADIFTDNTKGEWYFYNANIKSKGFSEFKSKWGKRLNVDNWRRKAAVDASIKKAEDDPKKIAADNLKTNNKSNSTTPSASGEINIEDMLANLPLTEEKLAVSHQMLSGSLFELGKLYQNSLEDYAMAVQTYERSLEKYPQKLYDGEIYMNLFFCYQKLGNMQKVNYYKNLLSTNFKDSKFTQNALDPKGAVASKNNSAATKVYEDIYNLFIEGQFEKAVEKKKEADKLYGSSFWNPQLLYIEAVYYIKQRNDNMAIKILSDLVLNYPASPIKEKANNLIEALKNRAQIEQYLTNLQVQRRDDNQVTQNDKPVNNNNVVTKPADKSVTNPVTTPVTTPANNPSTNPPPPSGRMFQFATDAPHLVVMILDKVDAVYVSETRSAFNRFNSQKFASDGITVTKDKDGLDKDRGLLVFSKFAGAAAAVTYADLAKKSAAADLSWLPASKYSFIVITEANFNLLKENKDLPGYLTLLRAMYPGKF